MCRVSFSRECEIKATSISHLIAIAIPMPNITGVLHMGYVLTSSKM